MRHQHREPNAILSVIQVSHNVVSNKKFRKKTRKSSHCTTHQLPLLADIYAFPWLYPSSWAVRIQWIPLFAVSLRATIDWIIVWLFSPRPCIPSGTRNMLPSPIFFAFPTFEVLMPFWAKDCHLFWLAVNSFVALIFFAVFLPTTSPSFPSFLLASMAPGLRVGACEMTADGACGAVVVFVSVGFVFLLLYPWTGLMSLGVKVSVVL